MDSTSRLLNTDCSSAVQRQSHVGSRVESTTARFILVVCLALSLAVVVDQLLARWLGLPKTTPTYRRIGPESGPQVFCAGSSLLQFGLSWREVSQTLNEGIENWGLGGSSPVEWEFSQVLSTNANLMVIGLSVYDLNENHFSDGRANVVPLTRTIADLWHSRATWQFSKRLLSLYPSAYVKKLFPTAGRSDAVLVGLRRRLREELKLSSAASDQAIAAFLPNRPVLEFGEDDVKVSDWPPGRTLRRVALMRSHIQGMHAFDGPKNLALRRMMEFARSRGRIIVVVLPVTQVYADQLLGPEETRKFESTLADLRRSYPQAQFVRLDELTALKSNDNFSDLVHLNSNGRRIATAAFLAELRQFSRVP